MSSESGFNSQFVPRKEVTVSNTQPGNPKEGDWWYDTGANSMKFYTGSEFKVPEGMTDSETNRFLKLVNEAAKARYAADSASLNMDDIFYDVFTDESKISSKTDVVTSTGTSGSLEINKFIETFESGGFTENNWTLDENSGITVETQQSTVKNGSYAAKVSSPGTNDGDKMLNKNKDLVPSDADGETFSFWFRSTSGGLNFNNGPFAGVRSGGSKAGTIRTDANDTGDLAVDTDTQGENLLLSNASTDTWYQFFIDIDETNNELTFRLEDDSGTQKGSATVSYGGGAIDEIYIGCRDAGSSSFNYYFDDVGFSTGTTTGSATTTSKSLDFTPSKVRITDERSLDSGATIEYTVKDGNGNTKTITESDLGSEIAVDFTGSSITMDIDFSVNSEGDEAKLKEYGVLFV